MPLVRPPCSSYTYAQQPDYAVPHLPEIYQKPLSQGHLAITDKMLGPNGVRHRGVSLYGNALRVLALYPGFRWAPMRLVQYYRLCCRPWDLHTGPTAKQVLYISVYQHFLFSLHCRQKRIERLTQELRPFPTFECDIFLFVHQNSLLKTYQVVLL